MRTPHARTTAAALSCAALLFTTACNGDAAEPAPPTETTASPTPTPTEPTPAWHDKYTPKQIQAYEEALALSQEEERARLPFTAKERINREAARKHFAKYWSTPRDQFAFDELMKAREVGVRITRNADILWSRPRFISKNGLTVFIAQCVDGSTIEWIENGTPIPQDDNPDTLRVVDLSRMGMNKPWQINGLRGEVGEKKCKG